MDIDAARNIQSIMNKLDKQEDKLEHVNRAQEQIQMDDESLRSALYIVGNQCHHEISLDANEISRLLYSLEEYLTEEKLSAMAEIKLY